MEYKIKEDNITKFYKVTYDEEELKKILNELTNYDYIDRKKGIIGGKTVTKFPHDINSIKKRVIKRIENNRFDMSVDYDSIEYNADAGNVTYEYNYVKKPDLYAYLDIIINPTNLINHSYLFPGDILYVSMHVSQFVIDGILNYVNSPELVDDPNREYDFKGLRKIYERALNCFHFQLVAVKEKVDTKETINGLSLKRSK